MKHFFKTTNMKRAILLMILLPVITFGQFQENQSIYPTKANLITISYTDSSDMVMKQLKTLLLDEMYSIKSYDVEFGIIETEYKQLKNASLRMIIRLKKNNIEIRGYATNNMSFGTGVMHSAPSEFRAELRPSTITVMAIGFEEMKRIANKYKELHNGSMAGVRE